MLKTLRKIPRVCSGHRVPASQLGNQAAHLPGPEVLNERLWVGSCLIARYTATRLAMLVDYNSPPLASVEQQEASTS